MLIRCPECSTGFRLPDGEFGDEPERVKCSQCDHVFRVADRGGAVLFDESGDRLPEQDQVEQSDTAREGDARDDGDTDDGATADRPDQRARPDTTDTIMGTGLSAELDAAHEESTETEQSEDGPDQPESSSEDIPDEQSDPAASGRAETSGDEESRQDESDGESPAPGATTETGQPTSPARPGADGSEGASKSAPKETLLGRPLPTEEDSPSDQNGTADLETSGERGDEPTSSASGGTEETTDARDTESNGGADSPDSEEQTAEPTGRDPFPHASQTEPDGGGDEGRREGRTETPEAFDVGEEVAPEAGAAESTTSETPASGDGRDQPGGEEAAESHEDVRSPQADGGATGDEDGPDDAIGTDRASDPAPGGVPGAGPARSEKPGEFDPTSGEDRSTSIPLETEAETEPSADSEDANRAPGGFSAEADPSTGIEESPTGLGEGSTAGDLDPSPGARMATSSFGTSGWQRAANLLLVVLLVGNGFLAYVAVQNRGFLDFVQFRQMLEVAFQQGEYEPREAWTPEAPAPTTGTPDDPLAFQNTVARPLEVEPDSGEPKRLLVLSGRVENQTGEPIRELEVRGLVFDEEGRRLAEQRAPVGVRRSVTQIRSNPDSPGDLLPQSASPLEPHGSQPFTLIFSDPPESVFEGGPVEYGLEIADRAGNESKE